MALSQMKLKKLKAILPGKQIEVTLTDNSSMTGIVNDNDGESLELIVDHFETVVDYSDISSFKILLDSYPTPIPPAPPPEPEKPRPEKPLLEQLQTYLKTGQKPSFWVSIVFPKASDADLKECLRAIEDRTHHQQMNSLLDQFLYSLHSDDIQRQGSVINRVKQTLLNDEDLAYDQDVIWLAANMMARRNRADAVSTFEDGNFYFEAAYCESRNPADNAWKNVTRLAILALFSGDTRKNELYTLLTTAILKTGDASLLPPVVQRLSSSDRNLLVSMLDCLTQAAGLTKPEHDDLLQWATYLAERYPAGFSRDRDQVSPGEIFSYHGDSATGEIYWDNTESTFSLNMIADAKLQDYLESLCKRDLYHQPIFVFIETRDGIPLQIYPDTDRESLEPDELIGEIYHLNWDSENGLIRIDNRSDIPFQYDDITDQKLKGKISDLFSSSLNGTPEPVIFQIKNSRAVNIRPYQLTTPADTPDTLYKKAGSIAADPTIPDRFRAANQILISLFSTPKLEDALEKYLENAIAQYKQDKSREILEQAAQIYEEYQNRYPATLHSLRTLVDFSDRLGKPDMIRTSIEKMLSLPEDEVSPKNYLYSLAKAITSCQDVYNQTQDETFLDLSIKYTSELETYLVRYPEYKKSYAAALLSYRLFNAVSSRDLDQAESVLSNAEQTGLSLTVSEDITRMLDELRARRAAEEQQRAFHEGSNADAIPEENSHSQEEERTAPVSVTSPTTENHSDQSSNQPKLPFPEEAIHEYQDTEGWDALNTKKKTVADYALSIPGEDRLAAMLAYLKAGSILQPELVPLYNTVSLAVDNPLETLDYQAATLLSVWEDYDPDYAELNSWAMAAITMQSVFREQSESRYLLDTLHQTSAEIFRKIPALESVYQTMLDFVAQHHTPLIDATADTSDSAEVNALHSVMQEAEELYHRYILTAPAPDPRFALASITKLYAYDRETLQARLLRDVQETDPKRMEAARQELLDSRAEFEDAFLSGSRISNPKISDWIDRYAQMGADHLSWNSGELSGSRRENIRNGLYNIVECILNWYLLDEQRIVVNPHRDTDIQALQLLKPELTEQLEAAEAECRSYSEGAGTDTDWQHTVGAFLLGYALHDLKERLSGTWSPVKRDLFFADFLRSDWILLDDNFQPDLRGTFCALPDFNVLARIRHHVEGRKMTPLEHMRKIYNHTGSSPNHGTARLILRYLELTDQTALLDNEGESTPWLNPDAYIAYSARQAQLAWDDFIQYYAMAENRGQIMDNPPMLRQQKDIIAYWYQACAKTQNYGFLLRLIMACREQIRTNAARYEAVLDYQLDMLIREHPDILGSGQDAIIRDLIRKQNFLTAERYMNDLRQPDGGKLLQLVLNAPDALNHLRQFWDDYAMNYSSVSNAESNDSLQDNLNRMNRTFHEDGQKLIDCWMKRDAPFGESELAQLLETLGWDPFLVKPCEIDGFAPGTIFQATYANSHYGAWNVQHSVAAFGSNIHSDGRKQGHPMYIIVLRDPETCDSLLRRFRRLENGCSHGSKLILLDYALTTGDRHALAEKIKKRDDGFSGSFPYLVVDRVVLAYLADHYSADAINQTLMSVGMPFSYYQPYAPNSATPLPPEMFIGRKYELTQIGEPTNGINLVYGGRQLGKSALLKKICADKDNNDNCRVILVELRNQDCAGTARKVSVELARLGILPDNAVTDHWTTLAEAISDRLSGKTLPRLDYLLILMDEADSFLKDCATCDYSPIKELKELQEKFASRFKFVLAGLHNVVRFYRRSALAGNSPIPQLQAMNVTPFETAAGIQLLTEPLSYLGFSLQDTQLVTEVLATTNNFPGLIQLYCKKLIESLRASDYAGYSSTRTPPYTISEDHIRRILADADFFDEIRDKLAMTLRVDEQDDDGGYYYPIALLLSLLQKQEPEYDSTDFSPAAADIGYSASRIHAEAVDLGIGRIANLGLEQIDTLLQEMKALNVLRTCSEPNTYRFSSKNFRDLLGTQDEVLTKLAEYEGDE